VAEGRFRLRVFLLFFFWHISLTKVERSSKECHDNNNKGDPFWCFWGLVGVETWEIWGTKHERGRASFFFFFFLHILYGSGQDRKWKGKGKGVFESHFFYLRYEEGLGRFFHGKCIFCGGPGNGWGWVGEDMGI